MPRRVGSDEVAIMMDGNIAIKRKNGDYVAYNKVTGRIFNAKKMVIASEKISSFMFLMSTASKYAY